MRTSNLGQYFQHYRSKNSKANVVSPYFRYETCMEKLQSITSSKPSVDNEAETSHVKREDFRDEVRQIIHQIEEAKQKDYVIWQSKIQVCIC
jgi:hypothetical protein